MILAKNTPTTPKIIEKVTYILTFLGEILGGNLKINFEEIVYKNLGKVQKKKFRVGVREFFNKSMIFNPFWPKRHHLVHVD